jgi:hypothetical protein
MNISYRIGAASQIGQVPSDHPKPGRPHHPSRHLPPSTWHAHGVYMLSLSGHCKILQLQDRFGRQLRLTEAMDEAATPSLMVERHP